MGRLRRWLLRRALAGQRVDFAVARGDHADPTRRGVDVIVFVGGAVPENFICAVPLADPDEAHVLATYLRQECVE